MFEINTKNQSYSIQQEGTSEALKSSTLKQKRKNDEIDERCTRAQSVTFSEEVSLLRFHTQLGDNEKIIMCSISLCSSQSPTDTTLGSDIEPSTKKNRSDQAAEKTEEIASNSFVITKKAGDCRSYPRPVSVRDEMTTQWKDPFHEDKIILHQCFTQSIEETLNSHIENFEIFSSYLQEMIANQETLEKVTENAIIELVERLRILTPFERIVFLDYENALKNFLVTFIERYTLESGLDLETYINASREIPSEAPGPDGTYVHKILPGSLRNQLLVSIPIFVSDLYVREVLEKICKNLSAQPE